MSLVRLLSNTTPFAHLDEKQLARVVNCCERQHYPRGAVIYQQNTPASKMYIILEGLVSLDDVVDSSTSISYERRGPKGMIGSASLLGLKLHSLTATCLEPTQVIAIDVPCLEKIFEEDYEVGFKVISEVAYIFSQRYERAKTRLYNVFKEIPVRLVCRQTVDE
ncbi:MAG: cyclic nucleotide-binding domain-containing protein [Deltaproteobacteria bacterium]|nr:cyclic nucleotide-binding domain-containing protein [Deltaproteobacteria bacterium]